MAVVVLAELEKLDFRLASKKVSVLESVDQISEGNHSETVFVLAATAENLHALKNGSHHIFVPSTMITGKTQNEQVSIYFELENYSFYQQAEEIIRQGENSKGVLRFRRTVPTVEDRSLFVGDLYILTGLLGEPEKVYVKTTNQCATSAYVIMMMNFGGGKMAHIEYTIHHQERIELEWSGIKNIIEFDSDEIKPARPGSGTTLPVTISVDSILANGHPVNEHLLERLIHFEKLIGGTGK